MFRIEPFPLTALATPDYDIVTQLKTDTTVLAHSQLWITTYPQTKMRKKTQLMKGKRSTRPPGFFLMKLILTERGI